ncbi:MAG TPA: EVE domain-containing protein [Gemmatimonadales bacterium]
MSYFLLKTEPSTYSWDDLVRQGRAVWDGVKNPAALNHLRAMQPQDRAFIYHTGDEKAVVGIAKVLSRAYPDPKAKDPKLMVVDLEPVKKLARPVTLASVKADRWFQDFALVRVPRLSVMPVTQEQWERILEM